MSSAFYRQFLTLLQLMGKFMILHLAKWKRQLFFLLD